MSDLEGLADALGPTLEGLGLTSFEVLLDLQREWDQLCGDHWKGHTEPVIIKDGELWIEATPPSMVRVLRYATGELMERLDGRFGEGVISSVRVMPKSSR